MILHRLLLNNFRGVAEREITFPEHGVVVLCGPNEIGKSSMLEALDLLIAYKDNSNHRDVKAVKPTHVDAGAQVEAEISTGEYRFVYRKRFHKKQMTELEVIAPRREQHTGEEAHQRVEAILAETLDTPLWEALRVMQSASTDAVDLSGSDALSRALDAAGGSAQASAPGTDTLLIDRIEAEYLRYFTPTGRPTKEWKTAIDRLTAAETAMQLCAADVSEVDERIARYEQLSTSLRELQTRRAPAAQRLSAAEQAHTAVAQVAEELRQAELESKAAAATATTSTLAHTQRRDLVADAARRAEALAAAQDELSAAQAAEAQARLAADRAAAEHDAAQAALTAQRRQRIDDAETRISQLTAELAGNAVTEDLLSDIEQSAALADRLEAQLQADAGTVEFTAPADLAVTVDGQPHTLSAGRQWSQPATAAVTVEVPGVLSVRITPGASAVKLRADLDAAHRLLRETLAQGGVADLAAARAADKRRRALSAEADTLTAALQTLQAGGVPAELTAARADADVRKAAAADAAAALTETSARATILRERAQAAQTALTEVHDKLTALRAAAADDAVAAAAGADAEALRSAEETVAALAARYAAAGAEALEAELAAAGRVAAELERDHDALSTEHSTLAIELAVMGREGRQSRLDEAQAELERARNDHQRIRERAEAAALLRQTMARHRENIRQRYVGPFRAELERLSRLVFGESCEIDVDAELSICSRTLDGATVPYASLSGGAREQLGILARLAGAALVAKEDTVPVVIDDALGFSDPDRLAKMGAVFSTVGDRGQVIVLTCTPGRYDGIADAEFIDLSA